MNISSLYNYYPAVHLSSLSDLYSESLFSNSDKICLISYLAGYLRVNKEISLTNQYLLFLENTPTLTSITWSYTLHNDKDNTTNTSLLTATGASQNKYRLIFDAGLFDTDSLKFNRITVTCTIKRGAETRVLELNQNFVKGIRAQMTLSPNFEHAAFLGNPDTTNFIVNYLKDYLPKSGILWNKLSVSVAVLGEESLTHHITALLYYKIINYFEPTSDPLFYDIGRNDNIEMENYILSTDPTAKFQDTQNGFCSTPLHLLNDLISNFSVLPDFLSIPPANKIYEMISRPLIPGPTMDGGTLNDKENEKLINESKQRLKDLKTNDINKIIHLYNLSRFPKSAISLSAILFKFLFLASQKNGCKECLYKNPGWEVLTLDDLRKNEHFICNLYSHYFENPVNKVLKFRRPAKACAKLAASPHIYTIMNFPPRILNAYFAKKIVKKKDNILSLFFRPIDSDHPQKDHAGVVLPYDSVLGKEVYLIVETIDLRGEELICQVMHSTAGGAPGKISLGGKNNLGALEYTADHRTIVGKFTALENNAGVSEQYVNLEMDHADKAFIRLYLRPESRSDFDNWAGEIQNALSGMQITNLHLNIQKSKPGEVYFGEEGPHGTMSAFLYKGNIGQFRLANVSFYDVFEKNNGYNYFSASAPGLRIGRIRNESSDRIVFYYHDEIDNEYWVCNCQFFTPRRRANGFKVKPVSSAANVPGGYNSDSAAPGIDAFRNFYYANGDIVTIDNPAAAGTDYGVIRYPVASADPNDVAELVRMEDQLNISFDVSNSKTVVIKYGFSNTQRRYANPGCYSAFIGMLAELNYSNVESSGMCFIDATSYPSVSHPNGDSIDTLYLESQLKRRAIIAAFRDWGFAQVISGMTDVGDGAYPHNAEHNDHLHAGNFPDTQVHIII